MENTKKQQTKRLMMIVDIMYKHKGAWVIWETLEGVMKISYGSQIVLIMEDTTIKMYPRKIFEAMVNSSYYVDVK